MIKNYQLYMSTTVGEADYVQSQWLGAMFYFLLQKGTLSFDHFRQKKFGRRNLLTGYALKLFGVALMLFLFWTIFS